MFTYVYDPIAAGAGKSRTDHLPRVTGVGSLPPVEDTVDTIKRLVPGIRSVGTLYNGVRLREELRHDVSVHVREAEVAALELVDEALVVDAQHVEDRRLQVVDRHGV